MMHAHECCTMAEAEKRLHDHARHSIMGDKPSKNVACAQVTRVTGPQLHACLVHSLISTASEEGSGTRLVTVLTLIVKDGDDDGDALSLTNINVQQTVSSHMLETEMFQNLLQWHH